MALTRINNNSLSAVTAAGIPKGTGEVVQVITSKNNNSYSLGTSSNTWNNVLFNDIPLTIQTANPTIQIESLVHCGSTSAEPNPYCVFRGEYKVGSGGSYAHFNPWNNADNGTECDFFFGGSNLAAGGGEIYRTTQLSCIRTGSVSASVGETLYFRLMRNGDANDEMFLNRANSITNYLYYGGLHESSVTITEIAG